MNWKKDISDYFRGKQTGKSANRLEREALSDPFLFEALEGLGGSAEHCEEIFSVLDKKLRQRVARGKMPFSYKWLVAASLALVCGVAIMLLRTDFSASEELMTVAKQNAPVMPFAPAPGVQELENSSGGDVLQKLADGDVYGKNMEAGRLAETCEDVGAPEPAKPAVAERVQAEESVRASKLAVYGAGEGSERRIRGLVTDTAGMPLPGVALRWREGGRVRGVSTDVDGRFI